MRAQIDERLIEICHGDWEGLRKPEIAGRWPEMAAAWRQAPQTVQFPGGESLADVRTRWQRFLADVDEDVSPLLIVTHDVIVRLAVLDARGQELSEFNAFTSENAALTEIDFTPGTFYIAYMNERGYLGDHRADPTAQAL